MRGRVYVDGHMLGYRAGLQGCPGRAPTVIGGATPHIAVFQRFQSLPAHDGSENAMAAPVLPKRSKKEARAQAFELLGPAGAGGSRGPLPAELPAASSSVDCSRAGQDPRSCVR